jgi:glycosyltransferase involved in cell wall biosynthesis
LTHSSSLSMHRESARGLGHPSGVAGNPPWHIIGEYPPQTGGVSDYTHLVATGLANQGEEVHVWCGACQGESPETRGVTVHRELGAFSWADWRRVGKQLDWFPARRRLLVQWVPHAYGYRSMNIGFCFWLWRRAVAGDQVEIMVHEASLPFARNARQMAVAFIHRLMTILILRSAARVWMSIPEWEARLRPYALGRDLCFRWLPIPSSIPVVNNSTATEAVRRRYAPHGETLIGHFGTYGWPVTSVLEPILAGLNGEPLQVLLMGIGSREYRERLVHARPELSTLVQATGSLGPEDLSFHVAACDLLIQPYPDGVSSRRTSTMVGLAHKKPVVTTYGPLTAPFWRQTGALAMTATGEASAFVQCVRQLCQDPSERKRIGKAAGELYSQRFDLSYTVTALRQAAADLAAANSTCQDQCDRYGAGFRDA